MSIGERIKYYRKQRQMSLRALGEKTGLTASYLSLIERDKYSPSIDSLRTISRALEISVFDFLLELENGVADPVVRRDKRRRIKASNSPYFYELLTPDLKGKIEMVWVELDPGDVNLAKDINVQTEEVILVIQGKMTIQLAEHEYLLESGDSIRFNGIFLRKIQSTGYQKLIFISAVTPPNL